MNLKMTPFKKNVMYEAKDLFYDGKFLKRLDANENLFAFQNGVLKIGFDKTNQKNTFEFLNVANSGTLTGNQIPLSFTLHQNYPNPFNPVTSIKYDLPNISMVNISIYNMMGRKVKTLVNGIQNPGFKIVQWNAKNELNSPVSAGLYFYTIQADGFKETKRMILLK